MATKLHQKGFAGAVIRGLRAMMDYVKAFGWMSFAAKAGDRQAAKNLAQLRQISGDRAGDGLKRAAEIEAAIKKQGEQDASGKPATPKSK